MWEGLGVVKTGRVMLGETDPVSIALNVASPLAFYQFRVRDIGKYYLLRVHGNLNYCTSFLHILTGTIKARNNPWRLQYPDWKASS